MNRGYKKEATRYGIGFVLSLVLTFTAYFLVTGASFSGVGIMIAIGALALVQLIVQLLFFLHLAEEARPRLRLAAFGFMFLVLTIVVVGSIWIMYHLNYNMMDMTPDQKTQYMMEEKGSGF